MEPPQNVLDRLLGAALICGLLVSGALAANGSIAAGGFVALPIGMGPAEAGEPVRLSSEPVGVGGNTSESDSPATPSLRAGMNGQHIGIGGGDVRSLAHVLKKGGYVLYFRHAITEPTVEEWDDIDIADCATQRNLSAAGRQQARAIGAAFAALGIEVARVVSSPFCRALDTARLAFGDAEASDELFFSVFADADTFERRRTALRAWLASPPPAGANLILVSHKHNLEDATGLSLELEGTAAIFRPHGDGTFTLIAILPPETWTALTGH
jgi:phosphohistidine phosphatase SixA